MTRREALALAAALSLAPRDSLAQAPATPNLDLNRDLETLRARLVASLLPEAGEAAKKAASEAASLAASLGEDGTWADIDYADQTPGDWKALPHLLRTRTLAQAARANPDASSQAREKAVWAAHWWIEHDLHNPNWFHNQISVPWRLGEICLLLGEIAQHDRGKALEIMDRASLKKGTPSLRTGANLVWCANNQILRGVWEPSPVLVAEAFEAMWDEVKVASGKEEGIQSDNSFHQHGAVLYSGGYGASFSNETSRFAELARQTAFAIPKEKLAILESLVLDGQAWMVRAGWWDMGAKGREIVRAGASTGTLQATIARLIRIDTPRKAELQVLGARLKREPNALPLIGNKSFPRSDYMAHHRANYFVSARGFSLRTGNTDNFINGEGKKSHFIADGASFFFQRGDEYRDIFPAWNWKRIPGTTIEQTPSDPDPKTVRATGKTSFVGGASDGKCGAFAMHLQRNSLQARKAWFFFDDIYVCLGAGITSASQNPVFTSINQCLLRGEVLGDRGALAAGTPQVLGSTVHHDGVAYELLAPAVLRLESGPRKGNWNLIGTTNREVELGIFDLWIDHGAEPQNASYAYAVRPNDGPGAVKIAAKSAVEVVSNTPRVQAVRHLASQMLQAVFWEAGSIEAGGLGLEADQPCVLVCSEIAGALHISLAQPGKSGRVAVQASRGGKTARASFDLPDGDDLGRSESQKLNWK